MFWSRHWIIQTSVRRSKSITLKALCAVCFVYKRQRCQNNFARFLENMELKIGGPVLSLKRISILWWLILYKPQKYKKTIRACISKSEILHEYGYFELSNKCSFWSRNFSSLLPIYMFVSRLRRSKISSLNNKLKESSILSINVPSSAQKRTRIATKRNHVTCSLSNLKRKSTYPSYDFSLFLIQDNQTIIAFAIDEMQIVTIVFVQALVTSGTSRFLVRSFLGGLTGISSSLSSS